MKIERQQIGLTKVEWKLVLSALVTAQKKPDDLYARLYRELRERLGWK